MYRVKCLGIGVSLGLGITSPIMENRIVLKRLTPSGGLPTLGLGLGYCPHSVTAG